MWVATQDLARSAAHPFYRRLNCVLDDAQFDAFVEGACQLLCPGDGAAGSVPWSVFSAVAARLLRGSRLGAGDCMAAFHHQAAIHRHSVVSS